MNPWTWPLYALKLYSRIRVAVNLSIRFAWSHLRGGQGLDSRASSHLTTTHPISSRKYEETNISPLISQNGIYQAMFPLLRRPQKRHVLARSNPQHQKPTVCKAFLQASSATATRLFCVHLGPQERDEFDLVLSFCSREGVCHKAQTSPVCGI